MRRGESDNGELPGQDSFLDIVANIVGILILLVMVVGLRASTATRDADEPEASTAAEQVAAELAAAEAAPDADPVKQQEPGDGVTEEELNAAVQQAIAKRSEAIETTVKAVAAKREVALRDEERVAMATFVAKLEEEIEEQRQKLGEDERRGLDLRTKLSAAELELEKLTLERIALVSAEPEVEEIENLPTPLARAAAENQIHIRLAQGHAKVIPWTALVEAAREKMRSNLWRLSDRDSLSVVAGPLDQFRIEYRLRRYKVATPAGQISRGVPSFDILPEVAWVGEECDAALESNSRLMSDLLALTIGAKPTVTVWIYPDSFAEFRKLNAKLFELGYAVAARPLPRDAKIGASASGTRSSVQ